MMSLNYSEQRQLHRIESRLLRSDPNLAGMLAVFGRLSAGQRMPAWEEVATRLDRLRQAAPLTAKAISVMVAAIGLLVSAILILPALVVGGPARSPQPTHQQTQPGPGNSSRLWPATRALA
jgi:Protein of unknown function (DUF3040)